MINHNMMHLGISENGDKGGTMIHGMEIPSNGVHIMNLAGIVADGIKGGTKAMITAPVLTLPLRRGTGVITTSKIIPLPNVSKRNPGADLPGIENITSRNATRSERRDMKQRSRMNNPSFKISSTVQRRKKVSGSGAPNHLVQLVQT